MAKKSAGILLYRINAHTEVFLVHPGGPFFKYKDAGAWTIPKGEFTTEDAFEAAQREFEEETGFRPTGRYKALQPITQKSGKKVFAWALEGDIDPEQMRSNTFELEWPAHSGQMKEFPEVDKGEWFDLETAKHKINVAQVDLIDELIVKLFED
jgi:predicted NUDIX family NTP pyrophosphohydrolase